MTVTSLTFKGVESSVIAVVAHYPHIYQALFSHGILLWFERKWKSRKIMRLAVLMTNLWCTYNTVFPLNPDSLTPFGILFLILLGVTEIFSLLCSCFTSSEDFYILFVCFVCKTDIQRTPIWALLYWYFVFEN